MPMTDPLGDMLTRIRNGQQATQGLRSCRRRRSCAPACSMCFSAKAISAAIREEALAGQHGLRIELKYFEGQPAIQHVARVSEAGPPRLFRRARAAARPQRPRHHHRLDAARRSVRTPKRATQNVGGEVLAEVF